MNNLLRRIRKDTCPVGLEFKVKSKMETRKNPERLSYLCSLWVGNRDDIFASRFWFGRKAKGHYQSIHQIKPSTGAAATGTGSLKMDLKEHGKSILINIGTRTIVAHPDAAVLGLPQLAQPKQVSDPSAGTQVGQFWEWKNPQLQNITVRA